MPLLTRIPQVDASTGWLVPLSCGGVTPGPESTGSRAVASSANPDPESPESPESSEGGRGPPAFLLPQPPNASAAASETNPTARGRAAALPRKMWLEGASPVTGRRN